MNKLFRFSWKYCICFISVGFLSSCGGGSSDKEVAKADADSAAKAAIAQPTPVPAPEFTGGFLDILWTDSLTFASLEQRKLVLKFTFGSGGAIELNGWTKKSGGNHEFDTLPNFRLVKGSASEVRFEPGTYFGNEILHDTSIINVKRILKARNAQYVIFTPDKFGGQVFYNISVSSVQPMAGFDKTKLAGTGSQTNPSPPKNY